MIKSRKRRLPRDLRRGFTLMEVLLVLIILGVLAAIVVPQLMGVQKQSYIDATGVSINGLEGALKQYQLNHDGNLPETGEGLQALITAPSNDKKWKPTKKFFPSKKKKHKRRKQRKWNLFPNCRRFNFKINN